MSNRRYVVPTQNMNQPNPGAGFQPSMQITQPAVPMQQGLIPPPITQQPQIIFPWGNEYIMNPKPLPTGERLPSYFRPTTTVIPLSKEVMDNAGVPIGIMLNPSLVANVPVINYSKTTVPRCSKCASYLSPYTKIQPDGNSYACPMCGRINQIPATDGVSTVLSQRQELTNQVYDIIAPRPYIAMPYITGSVCFIVDMSIPAIQSGFTLQFLSSIKSTLASLPDNFRISIMTTSDKITIFDFRAMCEFIVADLTDMSLQFPFVSLLGDVREQIDTAISQLLEATPTAAGNCFGSALEATERLMSPLGGSIICGIYGPVIFGPHAIPKREMNQTTTEADLIRLPKGNECKFYRDISFRLNRASCSINLFAGSDGYADIAVSGIACGLSGGVCKFYGKFDAEAAVKMHNDIFDTLTQEYNYNCSLRLRCSDGIKLVRPQGTFAIQNKDLLSFPILNPHHAVGFELNIEQPLTVSKAIFQLAMLWTTKDMVRMIRVFTFALPVSGDINLIRNSIDEGAVFCMLCKRAVLDSLVTGPANARLSLKKEVTRLVAHSLPFVSLYHLTHALADSDLLCPVHPQGVDGRLATIITFRQISIIDLILTVYPRLFALDTMQGPLPLANSSIEAGGVFLVHCIDRILIWVTDRATPEYLQSVFGCSNNHELPSQLPQLQTPEALALQEVINESMQISARYLPVTIFAQGDPLQNVFSKIIIDDRSPDHNGLDSWIAENRSYGK